MTRSFGTGQATFSLDWDPSGRWLAVGGRFGLVRAFDTKALEHKPKDFTFPDCSPARIAFLPNDASLVIACRGGLYEWQLSQAMPTELHDLQPAILSGVTAIDVSHDGRQVGIANGEGQIHVVDLNTRPAQVTTFSPRMIGVEQLAWSPDDGYLAVGGRDRTVRIWTRAGRLALTTPPFNGPVNDLAWLRTAAGNQLIVAGGFEVFPNNYIALLDTSILDATTEEKMRRADRILRELEPNELALRCTSFFPSPATECAALGEWLERRRTTPSAAATSSPIERGR